MIPLFLPPKLVPSGRSWQHVGRIEDMAARDAHPLACTTPLEGLQTAPRFPIMTGNVRIMILRSSAAERLRMYSRSRSTFFRTSSRH